MAATLFHQHVNTQAGRYTQRWNRIHHSCPVAAESSDHGPMWNLFNGDNLMVTLQVALDNLAKGAPTPLDLWQWAPIAMVYQKIPVKGSGPPSADYNGFYFAVVYASISSLITYIVAARKAKVVGWMNLMMDVVHEVGANVGNLNIFNVGASDAKQTCGHACCVLHHSRKGFVYEGTSHALHAAADYVWAHFPAISAIGRIHHYDVGAAFGLTPDFLQAKRTVPPAMRSVVTLDADASTKPHQVKMHLAFTPCVGVHGGSYYGDIGLMPGLLGACTDGDFTMFRRFLLGAPACMRDAFMTDRFKACGLRFCDRHKHQLIKADGEKAVALRLLEVAKDRQAAKAKGTPSKPSDYHLAYLLKKGSYETELGPVMEVTRAHPDPRVAEVFFDLFLEKAMDMGLVDFMSQAKKKHHPHNAKTGVYGQSTFFVQFEGTTWTGVWNKCGMSFTANCLEAGPNASLKRALGMQLSLVAIHAIMLRSCTRSSHLAQHRGFSVRQDYLGDGPQTSNKTSKQRGEENTGANWKKLWKDAGVSCARPTFVAEALFTKKGGVRDYSYVVYLWLP